MSRRDVIVYRYRGSVERAGTAGYAWKDGYSEDGPRGAVTFPWRTRRECQYDARQRGCIARFVRTVAS